MFAIDPDIPPAAQRITFEGEHGKWVLDGKPLGSAERVRWAPWPGRHRLALLGGDNRELQSVSFEVRGAGVKPPAAPKAAAAGVEGKGRAGRCAKAPAVDSSARSIRDSSPPCSSTRSSPSSSPCSRPPRRRRPVRRRLPAGIEEVTRVEGITEYRLKNGLQLLLVPDDSKPSTTVNVTYRVGSRHESYGETGMAHLLEHLLFKGTPTTRNLWAEFTKRGLRANGTTWYDRTNYFATFSASDDNLRWYLGWQADAMINSFIARADLDTEMTVVRNEMEAGENNPSRVLLQQTLAAMYQWHNYGKSDDRRPRRRRERRHPAAAGVLPQLLPAGQRDPDRLRPLRHRAGARARGAELRPDPAADADDRRRPTPSTRRRTASAR